MKVSELIEKLKHLPNHDLDVLVNVKTSTQVYGQAQVTPFTLPSGTFISKRKLAA